MPKCIAKAEIYYRSDEKTQKLAEKEYRVTASALDFFGKLVSEQVLNHRHAENFNELTPPNSILLSFSISKASTGTVKRVNPESMTQKEIERAVNRKVAQYFDGLSGRKTSDSNTTDSIHFFE